MPLGTALDGTVTYGLTEGRAAYLPHDTQPSTPPYDELEFPLPPAGLTTRQVSDAVRRSLGETDTPLNRAFFSQANLDMLQRALVQRAREKLHTRISRQSDTDMLLLMRRVYLETASNPTPHATPKARAKVLAEVARLNELVVHRAEDMVSRNIVRHVLYRRSLAQPLVLPHPAETARSPRWVLGSPAPPRNLNVVQM